MAMKTIDSLIAERDQAEAERDHWKRRAQQAEGFVRVFDEWDALRREPDSWAYPHRQRVLAERLGQARSRVAIPTLAEREASLEELSPTPRIVTEDD